MTKQYRGGIEERLWRLPPDEFAEKIERLKGESFDTFLADATQLAFAVPQTQGYKYPEEVLELPRRAQVRNKRRWRESVVFERLNTGRIEVSYNRSSGLANRTAPLDFHEGFIVSFDTQAGLAVNQTWTRRLVEPKSGLRVFSIGPDEGAEDNVRGAVIEGLIDRRHKQEQGAAYRRDLRKLGGRAVGYRS